MKFNYVIQNPPYKKSLHLDFFQKGLDILDPCGKMYIVEPATWLTTIRDSIFTETYTNLKNQIANHTKTVIIENLNNEFSVGLSVPCSVVEIDFQKTYPTIDFTCCGLHQKKTNLNDCNLIGNYDLVCSVFNKIKQKFGENLLKNHIYKKNSKIDKNTWFAAIAKYMRGGIGDPRMSDEWFINGLYRCYYYHCFNDKEPISKTPHHLLCTGYTYENPKYKDELAVNIYGTEDELLNFKNFVYNNDVCKFMNICIIQDMSTCSIEKYIPWINYKTTTEDFSKQLELTKNEIALIEYIIKKYNRNSAWFIRYMTGDTSIQIDQNEPWKEIK